MTEDIKKTESIVHPAIREFDNKTTLVARTGSFKGAINRYEILFTVPATDEEAKERYDCTLADLITMGVQIISHRPDYASLFNKKDEYSKELHIELQKLADSCKPGQKRVGKSAQTTAEAAAGRKAQTDAEALGFTTPAEMAVWVKNQQKKMNKKK